MPKTCQEGLVHALKHVGKDLTCFETYLTHVKEKNYVLKYGWSMLGRTYML